MEAAYPSGRVCPFCGDPAYESPDGEVCISNWCNYRLMEEKFPEVGDEGVDKAETYQ